MTVLPPICLSPRLDVMFAPGAVALVGASEEPGSVGRAVLENLLASEFGGTVFPVNPHHATVLGRKTFASVSAVPAKVDLAVIATPASVVPDVVSECASAGVAGAVILSSGFRESGENGRELEHRMLANASRTGLRIIGPNCLGVMLPHRGLNATFAAKMALPGPVAFLSQSGALCTAVLDWSLRENVGFSAFISLGSMADIGWGELISWLGEDTHTRSIVLYMESIGDARSFLSAAREVSFTKPIIAIKVGHTEAGARAAASHTGSMTGSDAVLDAAFRRAGILRVNTIEEVFDMAEVLGKQPRPRGPRLAIVANAGGPSALATDMLVASGGKLATLANDTMSVLDSILPPAWSHGNPIDMLGAASAELYGRTVDIALKDDGADGVLVVLTPQAMTDAAGTAERIATVATNANKPVFASWMGGASLEPARAILNSARIPTYDYPDAAARAFALMWRYSDNLRLLYERPALPHTENAVEKRGVAERLIKRARSSGRSLLTETESKKLLAAYGIPIVKSLVARREREAVRIANSLGYPAVLKLHSETITHKSDVGGVKLNLANSAAVRTAWREIESAISQKAGVKNFDGVSVQPMITRQGIELIVGSSVDAQFGPVLLFGAGGEWTEILQDRALAIPPLTETLAHRLMEQTRVHQALLGLRGHKLVDLNALAQLLIRFSHLASEQRWIAEIEINPLLASADGLLALDARVILHSPDLTETELPRLAIRPYPAEYVRQIRLKNGARVTLRPVRPEDEEKLVTFHSTLSDQSVRFRYFAQLPLATRIAHERLVRICFADYEREIPIVAEYNHRRCQEIIGVGRLNRLHDRNEAEWAVVVSDSWQNRGLGRQLLETLVRIATGERLDRIFGTILARNCAMLHICRALHFHLRQDVSGEQITAELQL